MSVFTIDIRKAVQEYHAEYVYFTQKELFVEKERLDLQMKQFQKEIEQWTPKKCKFDFVS